MHTTGSTCNLYLCQYGHPFMYLSCYFWSVFFFVVEDAALINLVFISKGYVSGMPLNIVLLRTGQIRMLPKLCRFIMCLLDGMYLSKFSSVLITSHVTYHTNIVSINIMDQYDAFWDTQFVLISPDCIIIESKIGDIILRQNSKWILFSTPYEWKVFLILFCTWNRK